MSDCGRCKHFAITCWPLDPRGIKICRAFQECSDKEWCMRAGLWGIEDEINEMEVL